MRDKRIYYGVDLSDSFTMVSYLDSMHAEPKTMSPVLGSGIYQIPTCIARLKKEDSWLYGDHAVRAADLQEADLVDQLLSKALSGDNVYLEGKPADPFDLLKLFVEHLLALAPRAAGQMTLGQLVFTLDHVDGPRVRLIHRLAEAMGYPGDLVRIIDYRESFCHYVYQQEAGIYAGDVALFSCREDRMRFLRLHRDQKTRPQLLTIEEKHFFLDAADRDGSLDRIIGQAFRGDRISAVYLIGPGFEGDWMKISMNRLCKGRRVFMGKNLYTKGACYCGRVCSGEDPWPFAYLSSDDLKLNVCLKLLDCGRETNYPLLRAGQSRYEAEGSCEVILGDQAEVDIWLQDPIKRASRLHVIGLTDLPKRPPRTSRLRIRAKATDEGEIEIIISDLGFGDLYPASGKVWTHRIPVPEEGVAG